MSWIEAMKAAADAAEKLHDAKLNAALADVKMEAVALAEENVRLREENMKLKEAAKLRDEMTPRADVYWKHKEDGTEDGPFCPSCWTASANRFA